ncbi:MAG: hypothetical protein ACOVQR_10475 [Flavobacterium sp.]|jgi:hypothetical protein|uniref:hypothetical protein n=1 Tax=Flavobacterium sp. TaxID=239 RepID=UPI003BA58DF8
MFEPLIGFSLFFLVMFLIIKFGNRQREKQYEELIENIKPETKLYIYQTKSSTMTWGLKNTNFLFNRCDIYLTETAIIILGFTKDSFFKQLSIPIILTKEIEKYSQKFPLYYVKKVNVISFENNIVKIDFGEKDIFKTEVKLKLPHLSEIDFRKIKLFAEKNNW